ncbi:MAG: tRNA (guanosine(46)-N7)-methyltransferase TrmB [Chloroflexi bacterium]|nr:tRNA (guanosine(46)-N7)-methyltransferase TrmB [Chloroflexota bacterium]
MSQSAEALRIYESRRLPWPVDWTTFFGREAPLLLEIGFGNGQFLVELAAERPEANVIGLEISRPALMRALRRLERRGLPNVRLVYGPAQQFLWSNCTPGTLAGVYANFPDPWPKDRHHHRRLFNARFLELLATRMAPGAHLDIATDHAAYAEAITDLLVASPYFESRRDEPVLTAAVQRLRTKYEQKALAEGRHCYYYYWQRNDVNVANPFPVPQELPMPHAVLRSDLTLEEIAGHFREASHRDETAIIRFVALYHAHEQAMLLIDTFVEEEPLAQRVGLTIRPRRPARSEAEDGELIVGLHEMGFPRPTPGIHAAVAYLARWLLSLDPEARLVRGDLPAAPPA